MTTDKQRALAAIDCLSNARQLLESSSDQAQHDIAEEVGSLLAQLESLQFFGYPLTASRHQHRNRNRRVRHHP